MFLKIATNSVSPLAMVHPTNQSMSSPLPNSSLTICSSPIDSNKQTTAAAGPVLNTCDTISCSNQHTPVKSVVSKARYEVVSFEFAFLELSSRAAGRL